MLRTLAIEDLAETARRDVLSVSLDVDPTRPEHQTVPPAYRIWLRNALRDTIDALPPQARKVAWQDADRVVARVRTLRPPGRGLMLFAAPDLWREFVLPVPLPNRVSYGQPDLFPLLWALHEYEPYAILAVDREHARIWTAYLGQVAIASEDALDLDVSDWRFKAGRQPTFTQRAGTGAARGAQRDTFDARVDAHIRRFLQGVAVATARLLAEQRIDRLIIGGPEEAASMVRSLLPAPSQRNLVAIVPMPGWISSSDVLSQTMPVALSEERHRDQALVAAILEGASARSGAVVGPVATLEALARGRVDVVVANGNLRGTVLRCTSCGHVTARETSTCPLCGSPVEGMSLPQALPALARHRGAALRIIRASVGNGLEPHQGLGALLRYAPGRATMEPGTG